MEAAVSATTAIKETAKFVIGVARDFPRTVEVLMLRWARDRHRPQDVGALVPMCLACPEQWPCVPFEELDRKLFAARYPDSEERP
jgi:hypothetical protein